MKYVEALKNIDTDIVITDFVKRIQTGNHEKTEITSYEYPQGKVEETSKIYSMAGTRCGWIVCKDPDTRWEIFNRRSYDSICGGVFDEWIFAIALCGQI